MIDKLIAASLSLLALAPIAGIGGAIVGSQSEYKSWVKAHTVYTQTHQRWLDTCDKHHKGATCRLQDLADIANAFNN